MALILDTNALSAFADGVGALRKVVDHEPELAIPVIVLGEYLFGVRRSRHRVQYESWLTRRLPDFLIVHVESATAEQYAVVRSELKAAGTPIPSNDLWIAALAKQYGFAIVTRDKHFQAIRGVQTLTW